MNRARTTVDINALAWFVEQIGSHQVDLIQHFRDPVYHYTDLQALISIVRGKDLWLSNLRYLNDAHEWSHGYEVARQVIEHYDKWPAHLNAESFRRRVARLVKQPPPAGVYVCCFCFNGNMLSQWRAYGENGTGVSLKFIPAQFAPISGPDMPLPEFGLMRLWRVFYEPEQQKNIMREALRQIPDHFRSESEAVVARKVADAIHFFMPTFKNVDFKGENECRLIFTPARRCRVRPSYRVARGMLIPYYSLTALSNAAIKHTRKTAAPTVADPTDENQGFKLPLQGVTVGPSTQRELNTQSVRMLLNDHGYATAEVTASDTPYRG